MIFYTSSSTTHTHGSIHGHSLSQLSQHIMQQHGFAIVIVQKCMIFVPHCPHPPSSLRLLLRWLTRPSKSVKTAFSLPRFRVLCLLQYQHIFSYCCTMKWTGFYSRDLRKTSTFGLVQPRAAFDVAASEQGLLIHPSIFKLPQMLRCCWHTREYLLCTSSWKTKINLPLPPPFCCNTSENSEHACKGAGGWTGLFWNKPYCIFNIYKKEKVGDGEQRACKGVTEDLMVDCSGYLQR